ncbi:MAG: hypothetical protein KBD01_03500 [Acidobacteria bacterium]|nr:hypothetical protein [Acidobacteriota bacterium]
MTPRTSTWSWPAALLAAALLAPAPAPAEISAELSGLSLLLPGGDNGEPWPTVRPGADRSRILNEFGGDNGDGFPAIGINPRTREPEAAWAFWDGHDHEIVVSRWDGMRWTAFRQLTNNDVEDLDPALEFTASGDRRFSWWRSDVAGPRILYMEDMQGLGSPEENVSDEAVASARPGIAIFAGLPRVAYQAGPPGNQDVVVARRDGDWKRETLFRTDYLGPHGDGDIDVQVHVAGGELWVDWINRDGQIAYRYLGDSGWLGVEYESYEWDASVGVTEEIAREFARRRIRDRVMR